MLGQRGSGKTVLLWELADRAREQGFVVATPTIVAEGMLERIVEKIQDAGEQHVEQDAPRLAGGTVGAFGFSVGLEFTREVRETKTYAYQLTQLVRRLNSQGHGVLVLVDELQASSDELRQLVAVYQELVGEGRDVAMVLAGLPAAVSEVLNEKVLTFLNRARKISLPSLAAGEVDAFLRQAFEQLGVGVSAEMRAAAVAAIEGSPYMLQLLGHYMVLNADDAGELDAGAFAASRAAAESDFENDICRTTLAALSNQDIAFLKAMAGDEGESAMADVAERMGVTSDYAQKYRRRLIDVGVIEAPRRGHVAFAVPYLADYLRNDE